MIHQRDPFARFKRALAGSANRFGLSLQHIVFTDRPWSSATFTGHRLSGTLTVEGAAIDGWLAALPEEELAVSGLIVADIVASHCHRGADGDGIVLEALLLEA
ncbi:hypothetical protein NF700_01375 [Sphingomonadaceae bacterium OTU29MARTA1]|uniref:hypothetical protein n=1 Tax=Sphingomonas sp. Leaf37 TaxID=2876552 RepID=UPI001E44254D|nr:hypothetical protein [Sphingomonas sp. Leaf37]USU05317.1 hypothetical protein NF699_01025 [Sphingomonadaceae bacterium OTU29LAMAA1]USU08992.1 hypothetical protein NF700_01375 [Sphingomonadaceae bacterium OTU29MARTA1]